MTNSPLVSIVVPTFNRAKWLPISIGSVIAQSYSNWELIVWDDGSIDDTKDVVYSFNDRRIHYFEDINHGVSYARNHAIEKSKGEFIAFLDSDDQWVPDKLSRQIDVLERYPHIACLFGNYINKDLVTGRTGDGFTHFKSGMDNLTTKILEKSVFQIIEGMPESSSIPFFSLFIQLSSVIIRRHALIRVGPFNENLKNCEDSEYFWRMGLKDITFAFIDEKLMNRNKPPESLSSQSVENRQNYIVALDYCYAESLKFGRYDLAKRLKVSYRNAWLGMIRIYNVVGNRNKSLKSFLNSCKYGVSWQSALLLLEALFGYKKFNRIKMIIKK